LASVVTSRRATTSLQKIHAGPPGGVWPSPRQIIYALLPPRGVSRYTPKVEHSFS